MKADLFKKKKRKACFLPHSQNGKRVREIRENAMKKNLIGNGILTALPVLAVFLLILIINIITPENAIAMRRAEQQEFLPLPDAPVSTEGPGGRQSPGPGLTEAKSLPVGETDIYEAESCEEEIYIGELEIAAYCGCDSCVGCAGTFRTYSGGFPEQGRTVAANLDTFQIGDILRIGSHIYTVEDKVSDAASEQLCIYFSDHEEALGFGRQTYSVYKINQPIEEPSSFLGRFLVTGYCSCDECCGKKEQKLTKTETAPRSGHTIAVDPEVLPFGTEVTIDGVTYTAEDTGNAIKGRMIDIYFDTHQEAVNFGRQEKKVYLAYPSDSE